MAQGRVSPSQANTALLGGEIQNVTSGSKDDLSSLFLLKRIKRVLFPLTFQQKKTDIKQRAGRGVSCGRSLWTRLEFAPRAVSQGLLLRVAGMPVQIAAKLNLWHNDSSCSACALLICFLPSHTMAFNHTSLPLQHPPLVSPVSGAFIPGQAAQHPSSVLFSPLFKNDSSVLRIEQVRGSFDFLVQWLECNH